MTKTTKHRGVGWEISNPEMLGNYTDHNEHATYAAQSSISVRDNRTASSALPLEGVDDIGIASSRSPPSVLSVGHGVSDHSSRGRILRDSPGSPRQNRTAEIQLHASSTARRRRTGRTWLINGREQENPRDQNEIEWELLIKMNRRMNWGSSYGLSPALPLEGVDDIHRRHGLPPSVLGVGHGVSDHILEEDFEDSPGLLVDEAGDTLHASSTSQTANGRLGNPLDVVAKHLPVTLGSSLAQSLASLSTAGHFCRVKEEI
nr:histone H4 [Ipomoea batatas]